MCFGKTPLAAIWEMDGKGMAGWRQRAQPGGCAIGSIAGVQDLGWGRANGGGRVKVKDVLR